MNYNLVETFILGLRSYEMEVGFYDLFTSYEMELEWYGMVLYVSTWCDVSIIGYVL